MADNATTNALMKAWMRRGWLAYLLLPLSIVFGLLRAIRLQLFRFGLLQQRKLRVPVIVVGNIFIGGTGKTPFTIWLLEQLKLRGFRPGVISRGYGTNNQVPVVVVPASTPSKVGDEPLLIAQQSLCPVVVGRNRYEAGRAMLARFPDVNVIISDDGLQHYALCRDVEVMLFDSRGVGNGWLLPAGPLREPVNRSRDITVVNLNPGESLPTGVPADAYRMTLVGDQAVQLIDAKHTRKLRELDNSLRIVSAAGIGNPERFFAMLRSHGVDFAALPLPDHFDYASNPFKHLTADLILITEKDAVKCRQFGEIASDPRIWVVSVEAQIDAKLVDIIVSKIGLNLS